MRSRFFLSLAILSALAATTRSADLPIPAGTETPPGIANDPRYGLLTPLPESGGVPHIVELMNSPSDAVLAHRARERGYARQIRDIRRKHFGSMRKKEIREEGLHQLSEFIDPASFKPMIEELSEEKDDVREAMLDHFASSGENGQAALAWVAINLEEDAMRNEAIRRMVSPPAGPALKVLDASLRSPTHRIANNAGILAGTIGAVEAIPLLIFAQTTFDPLPERRGDIAWIAIVTQQPYIVNIQPAVGNHSAAYQPVLGVVSEGVVLRVHDAVVTVYRTDVHWALTLLAGKDWGGSTEHLGYDIRAWWQWYNNEYVPYKNDQARLAELEQLPPKAAVGDKFPGGN